MKGEYSAKLIEEVFTFILGERRIYPTSYFQQETDKKYSLVTYHIKESHLKVYFERLTEQLTALMEEKKVQRVDLVFTDVTIESPIEVWSCNIEYPGEEKESSKESDITASVSALFRQIQNSIAFLPIISTEICKFDIQVHCDRDTNISASAWEGTQFGLIPFDYLTDNLRAVSPKGISIAFSVSYQE